MAAIILSNLTVNPVPGDKRYTLLQTSSIERGSVNEKKKKGMMKQVAYPYTPSLLIIKKKILRPFYKRPGLDFS